MDIIVSNNEANKRLDMVLCELFKDCSRSHIKNMISQGKCLVDNEKVKAGYLLKKGQKIFCDFDKVVPLDATADENVEFEIIYEDDDLIVVNKPQGLVVHPCNSTKNGTLVNGLLHKIKNLSGINGVLRPGIVHRLDKNTSGLMVVAKNDYAHIKLAEQIKNKTCRRKYLALLEGHLKENQGKIETFIERNKNDRKKMAVSNKGKKAITNFKVIKSYLKYQLVEFSLETGRTHQIRVHAKMLGHPVVGDDIYGKQVNMLKGQLLHSYYLSFFHPTLEKEMAFQIDLPEYFENYLKKLK